LIEPGYFEPIKSNKMGSEIIVRAKKPTTKPLTLVTVLD